MLLNVEKSGEQGGEHSGEWFREYEPRAMKSILCIIQVNYEVEWSIDMKNIER